MAADVDAVLGQEFEAAAGQMAVEPDAVVVVGAVVDLGVLGQVGQDAAVGDAGLDLGLEGPLAQGLADGRLEPSSPSPWAALMATDSAWWALSTSRYERSGTLSALLSTRSVGWSSSPSSASTALTASDLALGLGAGGIDDVQEQVGLAGLLERGLERRDQGVRQVADEADRVGEQGLAAAAEPPAAGAGVERREQLVLDQDAGLGQRVHQRALAGVGVADQRDGRHVAPAGDLALLAAPGSWRASP